MENLDKELKTLRKARDDFNKKFNVNIYKNKLAALKRERKEWWTVKGGQLFLNEDLNSIIKLMGLIYKASKESRVSITFVDENTPPEYPDNTDIINAWCFSYYTPRCPYDLADEFKFDDNQLE